MSNTSPEHSPPPFTEIGYHAAAATTTHDETARFNFIGGVYRQLAKLAPGNRAAYNARVAPRLKQDLGRAPEDRHEVHRGMKRDPFWQWWSALRRNNMEYRWAAGRSAVLRQLDAVNATVADLNAVAPERLKLDASVQTPPYIASVDNHLMPGSYQTEVVPGDAFAGAIYDCGGLFLSTAGFFGPYSDGAGRGLAGRIKDNLPDFKPRRILEIGCTVGHTLLPFAELFPQAEVVGVDIGAPVLRYAHARATALGFTNVSFAQMDGEALSFPDGHFDLIFTSMFLHETSGKALPRILRECHRVLAKDGLNLHLELPAFHEPMDLIEQCMREWDCYYNGEPFWRTLNDLSLADALTTAGFARSDFVSFGLDARRADGSLGGAPMANASAAKRRQTWTISGAWKRLPSA